QEPALTDPLLGMTLIPSNVGIVVSRSASSNTMAADFPPSSSTVGLICAPHTSPIREPMVVDPVKLTMSTSGWLTRCSDASGPAATRLISPGGKPTSATTSAIAKTANGFGSGTLMTTVHPAATAGATFCAVPGSEKL